MVYLLILKYNIMKKKDYLKPMVQVVKLQQQAALLQASVTSVTVESATWGEEEDL